MKFMVIVKAGKDCEAGKPLSEEMQAAMGKYNDELVNAGVLLALERLHPSSNGARVKFAAGKTSMVTDGPFIESKELVGGFWLWDCQSKEEAIKWLQRAPFEDTEVELRQVREAGDFGGCFTPEPREQQERPQASVSATH